MRRVALFLVVAAALAVAGCLGASSQAVNPTQEDPDPARDDGAGDGDSAGDETGRDDSTRDDSAGDGDQTAERTGPYAPGWPDLAKADVRPGVTVVDGTCTSNFLFRSPDNRTLYLGTAAHCVPDVDVGQAVTVAGDRKGVLAYSSFKTQKRLHGEVRNEANDFALIRLPNSFRDEIHPAVLDVGGPTGIATDVAPGDRVRAYGNSSLRPALVDPALRPREGYVTHRSNWTTSMYLAGPGVPGDSGSAALTAGGKALGVVVTLEIAPEPASNNAANLPAVLAYAIEHGPRTYELVTWETLDGSTLGDA